LLPISKHLSVVKAAARSNIECKLVYTLSGKGLKPVPRFGSSDCRSGCKGHLLYAKGSLTSATRQAFSSFTELGLSPEVLELNNA